MGRRQRIEIKGHDPEYSHTFRANRPKLPNGMPPTVRIPGQDDLAKNADPQAAAEAPKAELSPDTAVADQVTTPPETATEAKTETKPETPRPPAKPSKRPKAERPTSVRATPEDGAADAVPSGDKRKVSLKVAVTTAHVEAMKPLVAKGLAQRDVMALAGRRTMKRFNPTTDFVPMPEGERVPMTIAYSTTKYLPADMLDAMRDQHDPLRVKSDAAMVRGQFETLFWSVLDEVIEELRDHKG